MRTFFFRLGVCVFLAGPACGLAPARHIEVPGLKQDGSVLLPNLWSLLPAGRQVLLGDFPVNIAVHPGGRYAAVLHAGHGQHEIIVVDVAKDAIVSRVTLPEAFYGIAFSKDGSRLFAAERGTRWCINSASWRAICLSTGRSS